MSNRTVSQLNVELQNARVKVKDLETEFKIQSEQATVRIKELENQVYFLLVLIYQLKFYADSEALIRKLNEEAALTKDQMNQMKEIVSVQILS